MKLHEPLRWFLGHFGFGEGVREVSKTIHEAGIAITLDEAEITFSELLNAHVFVMCDAASLKGSAQVLGLVN